MTAAGTAAPTVASGRSDPEALRLIRAHNAHTRAWIVVLDDDPTGSQAVYDVTVLVEPTAEDLLRAARGRRTTFVWTNTRSMPEATAAGINRDLVRAAIDAGATAGVRPVFVSRGDSTLRGHFAAELSALTSTCASTGRPVDGVVFVPAFLEAGRFTAQDVQWVRQPDGSALPAADTEFARDATFGYRETNLRDWVAARTGLYEEEITSIPLDELRNGVADRILLSLRQGALVIANATEAADLETLALACQHAERAGRRLVYRTGPSFVRALAGRPARGALTASDLGGPGGFGLTVVGSHTALTTRQLDAAVRRHHLTVVELDVDAVRDTGRREDARGDTIAALERALRRGHAALVTSRSVRTVADDPQESLAIARLVSDEVCTVVRGLAPDLALGYVVAKGGITSHEVAARGLDVREATVLGQLFPGTVSVLRLGPETSQPGMPYVVFPGNVGADDALAHVLGVLTGPPPC